MSLLYFETLDGTCRQYKHPNEHRNGDEDGHPERVNIFGTALLAPVR